ncbi:MAG: sensor histidine kinase, partial [Acidobacteriales bacterium]
YSLRVAASCGALEPVAEQRVDCSAAAWRRLAQAQCAMAGSRRMDLVLQPNWRSRFPTCWSVPLTLDGRRMGVIQFGFSKTYEWLPREVELLSAAAERCVLAAEKARLVRDLAAREGQIRELAGRMLEVEERERRRISSELHDETGQSLLCIRLQLEMLEAATPENCAHLKSGLSEARALTESTIVETRRLISALSPAVLQQLGLTAALRQLAARLRQSHQMKLKLHLAPPRELGEQAKTAIYRLVQECLSNVARHSSALNVNISVTSADGRIRLCVEDDGVGFRVEEAAAKRGSFGLAGMRERVALLGGKFHVHSQPGQGTRVCIGLPLPVKRGRPDPGS